MSGLLATIGLDVEYVRGEGTTLYRVEGDREVAVLDHVGGYGSLLLGHNHPAITARARALLDAGTPVHTQFSRHGTASAVGRALNRVLARELEDDEPFSVIFASTGAEAVEAAMKHAELDRGLRVSEAAVTAESALAEVDPTAAVPDELAARLGVATAEEVVAKVREHNAAALASPPVYLALTGGFHGKLAGSVQLTHNPAVRLPFRALAAQAVFLAADDHDSWEVPSATLWEPVVVDGRITLREHDLPVVTAIFAEPIQGEGGIRELSPDTAARLRELADRLGCPLAVDEIQTGMGRTGRFLAGAHIGLRGDYYTLGKTLGGGLAKVSVLLIRQSRYRAEFEFAHSSTFAKDGFSSAIALAVLEELEADGGRVYRLAAERGARLFAALSSVAAGHPGVVADVRGRGLMLGLEFTDQSGSASPALADVASRGLLGYALAGYFLHAHDIRIFPTASAPNTLRFEPSIQLGDEEITRTGAAVDDVCRLLAQDPDKLLGA